MISGSGVCSLGFASLEVSGLQLLRKDRCRVGCGIAVGHIHVFI